MGSNQFPFGPHGTKQDPREVPRHPGSTGTGSSTNIGDGWDAPAAQPLRGDPGSIGLYVGSFLIVCCCWPIWVCLYPLAAAAAGATLLASFGVLHLAGSTGSRSSEVLDGVRSLGFLAGVAITIVVLYIVGRAEHRLARYPLYRYSRHIVRLPLLGLVAVWGITDRNFGDILNPLSWHRSENMSIFVIAMVIWQVLLWKAAPLRRFWHAVLRYSGFRPRDLD